MIEYSESEFNHILNELKSVVYESSKKYKNNSKDYNDILGNIINVTMDRPMGYVHHGIPYPVNYGYVKGILGGDGEEQDVYLLGVNKPVKSYKGAKIIAIIHRLNDNEDKWVACPKNMNFTKKEIIKQTEFMEKFFKSKIYTIDDIESLKESADTIYETPAESHLSKNFKKKTGKTFRYIDIDKKEADEYLKTDDILGKNISFIHKEKRGEIAICNEDDKLAGYIFVNKGKNWPGHIQPLFVFEDYRGYGISDRLMDDAIKKYKAEDLVCANDNEIAINLYKKHNFVIVGVYENKRTGNKEQYYMVLKSKLRKKYRAEKNPRIRKDFERTFAELSESKLVNESYYSYENIFSFEYVDDIFTSYFESDSSVTLDMLKEFNKELNSWDYGVFINGKKYTDSKKINWSKYKTTPIAVMKKHHVGICWDFVNYQHAWFKENHIKDDSYLFVMQLSDDPNDIITHTFSIVTLESDKYWFESSWMKHQGVHKVDSYKDVVKELVKNYDKTKNKPYSVFKYNPFGMDKKLTNSEFFDISTKKLVFDYGDESVEEAYSDMYSEIMNELITEAATDTHIIIENLYPKISDVLSTPVGDKKFKQLIGGFMDRNSTKLHTAGPMYLIPFADRDKAEYFNLFKLEPKYLKELIKQVTDKISTGSQFKLLSGNPIFFVFYCCIRYYMLKKDQKGLNSALAIYAISNYPSVYRMSFPYDPNPAVMQYTMDNLSEKYIMKQAGHVFGGLYLSINNSYKFLQPYMRDASDKEIIRFIQRIRNDQKSMLKNICDQYMKNHRAGNRVKLNLDSTDAVQVDLDSENNTTIVETTANNIVTQLITSGLDLRRVTVCKDIAQISLADCRFYLSKIVTDKYVEDISRFIYSVLFLYLYNEKKNKQDINSSFFIKWSTELFRKTNSNDPNIKNIKITLDKWAEDTGIHAKFKREASRVNYKKAIFWYFILSIQAYNK